jgi:prepilin peptidase CpaA
MAMQGFPASLWQNGLAFALILTAGAFAFAAELLGGGDVKLLAAAGAWMSLAGAVWLISATFIAGGVIALFFIATRRLRRHAGGPGDNTERSRIPYGLAIVAGAFMVFGTQLSAPNAQSHRLNAFPTSALRR